MDDVVIKKLSNDEEVPYELLLLADPSMDIINDYVYRGDCYVAYINNNIVAAYIILRTRPLTLELVNIAVSEAYQGKGIGKRLIFSAIDMARGEGARVLEGGTGNSSLYQLALYQKCGFRIVGIDRDFFKKHYKEIIIENGIECIDMIRLSLNL
ncbi:GNAT family N-acetyltransferase [Clostridium estertheticum]|uniref:Acetyltransferase n=1 Tax=Clostridium estertheticum subsp. estertheticum TaxID=1552 RepID=A0A1J0GIQ6_9CLOT|nr:GNAT family N-acetyltransferase [Clostridium estertheticum]APC41244.1 acetyltransferase [Clostridium estertheticum subsp. estertheticum]MBU3174092.1 GNAT family N-acetyltransferase [Clostridium estertheticum]MBZ9616927.1 GNAT family N-acetyltransferase [Clostridium estertheticum subsp. laramiense]WAG72630.1 GNAT family N-acetyltransferase [Clostridium estertheticum]